MSTPNPALVAAAPPLVKALQAIKQFEVDLGTDPLKFPVTWPGARVKLAGSLMLLAPELFQVETVVLEGLVGGQIDSAISKLQALGQPGVVSGAVMPQPA